MKHCQANLMFYSSIISGHLKPRNFLRERGATLCHTLSHFATLYHTLPHSITLLHTVSHCATLYHTVAHCINCATLSNCTTFYRTLPHSITLYHTLSHCATHPYVVHNKTFPLTIRIKAENAKKCEFCMHIMLKPRLLVRSKFE
jgi:hypothetical protein